MNGEVSAEQAQKIITMLTEGGAIENVNAPLALRLIPLAEELDNLELVNRLLEHAESTAVDELESGWVKFETLRHNNSSIDEFVELAALAEKMNDGEPLAAAVLHHVGLLYLSVEKYDDCQVFTTRSMRIREQIEDQAGLVYSLAVLEACEKRQNRHDSALTHGTRRLEILTTIGDQEGLMESLADVAHTQATLGNFDAAIDLYNQSLELSNDLEDISGQFVARWGLADIAEIQGDYQTAMLHLSDCLHSFIAFGLPAPIQIRERLDALTKLSGPNEEE
jgi:tetratricopeptide (TPR) repeat protein